MVSLSLPNEIQNKNNTKPWIIFKEVQQISDFPHDDNIEFLIFWCPSFIEP